MPPLPSLREPQGENSPQETWSSMMTLLIDKPELESLSEKIRFHPWDFPGGPVVKTLIFQCRDHEVNPWSGN